MENNKIFEEFNKRRQEGNDRISDKNFLQFNRFLALDSRAYEEGEVPVKYKELMGLVGSMVLRCNDCILYHIETSYKAGCTEKELLEAMNIGLVIGGSIVIPHLRIALEAMDELYKTSN